jgi:hypothetical protein
MAMDELRLLLAAAEKQKPPERGAVGWDLTSALVMAALALGCLIALVVLLAAALAIAVYPKIGNAAIAALIAAAAFALVGFGLVLTVRWQLRKTGGDVARRTGASLLFGAGGSGGQLYDVIDAAGLSHPRSIGDFALLVGLGFISGLKGKGQAR